MGVIAHPVGLDLSGEHIRRVKVAKTRARQARPAVGDSRYFEKPRHCFDLVACFADQMVKPNSRDGVLVERSCNTFQDLVATKYGSIVAAFIVRSLERIVSLNLRLLRVGSH